MTHHGLLTHRLAVAFNLALCPVDPGATLALLLRVRNGSERRRCAAHELEGHDLVVRHVIIACPGTPAEEQRGKGAEETRERQAGVHQYSACKQPSQAPQVTPG